MGQTDGRRVKAVDTSCRILTALRKDNGRSVSDLSKTLDLSAGAVHTHLATLKDHGLITQEGTTYRLGFQLVPLGQVVKHDSDLYRAAKQVVDQVAQETGECVHLISENHGQRIILYEEFGKNAVGTKYHTQSRESPSDHLHYRAAGKAILAHLPASRVNNIIDEYGLIAVTKETIVDKDELLEQLSEIRSKGYAVNDEEELRGIRAVGAPILNNQNKPLGAISVSAPCSRLKDETFEVEYPEIVKEAANIIEVGYHTGDFSIE